MEVSGELHAWQLYTHGKSPWYPLDWVGSGAVLNAVVKRKIPSLRRESNPRTPIVQPVAYVTTITNAINGN
jgi:hypothetical protein